MNQTRIGDVESTEAGRVNRVVLIQTWLVALACVVVAYIAANVAFDFGFAEGAPYLFFLFAVVAVGFFSRSYPPTIFAVVVCAIAMNWRFVRPYYAFGIDHRASIATFSLFVAASLMAGYLVVHAGREADSHDAAHRRTKALFDLTGSFFYAHGTAETVDTALKTVENLFGRSSALYLSDPFVREEAKGANRDAVIRTVEGDLAEADFMSLIEHYVVHWVFENHEKAGGQTDIHEQSEIIYLPLLSQGGMEGVLAVSVKNRPLSDADLEFLGLVSNEIMLALERQSLAAKHRRDLRSMGATQIRDRFMSQMVEASSLSNQMVHALGDALLTVKPENVSQREALERAVSDETTRAQIMFDRIQSTLKTVPTGHCDVSAEAKAAVEVLRTGLSGKVIQLDAGQSVPAIVADAPLVRLALSLVIEAACTSVSKGGVVEVDVRCNESEISVVVQDNRPELYCPEVSAAFELAESPEDGSLKLVFDAKRAAAVRSVLLDRSRIEENDQAVLETVLQAIHLPLEAGRSESSRESSLNRQRVMRLDRLEYGLYMAALIFHAHKGAIKMRGRLGGGVVVTMTLPRPVK